VKRKFLVNYTRPELERKKESFSFFFFGRPLCVVLSIRPHQHGKVFHSGRNQLAFEGWHGWMVGLGLINEMKISNEWSRAARRHQSS
jgi:hypothetical protein